MERLILSAQPLALRRGLCKSCLQSWNTGLLAITSQRPGLQNSNRIQRRSKTYKGYANPGDQANPITGFYAGSRRTQCTLLSEH
jgi:hypothetical protein